MMQGLECGGSEVSTIRGPGLAAKMTQSRRWVFRVRWILPHEGRRASKRGVHVDKSVGGGFSSQLDGVFSGAGVAPQQKAS